MRSPAPLPADLRVVDQYLERYADPVAQAITLPAGSYDAAIVIPARAEAAALEPTLDRIAQVAPRALSVVVVNARDDDDEAVHNENRDVLILLRARERRLPSAGAVFPIDCASPGARLLADQGVGRARRIGADVALRLFRAGRVASNTLYFTDADAWVPDDYIARGALDNREACAVLPFVHGVPPATETADEATLEACAAYEASLRLYALGLDAAGSPHAYCTLGSTLTTRVETYAQVRGMPLRTAGEDFHYLDKAARTGVIARRGGAPLVLSPRASPRVPFGTGPSVAQLLRAGTASQMSLHPDLYTVLRAALDALEGAAQTGTPHAPDHAPAAQAWHALALDKKLAAAFASLTTATQRRRAAHTVFSALRTRQFLHRVRDASASGATSVFDAATAAPFVNNAARTAAHRGDARALCAALQSLCALRLVGACGPCAPSD